MLNPEAAERSKVSALAVSAIQLRCQHNAKRHRHELGFVRVGARGNHKCERPMTTALNLTLAKL